MTAPHAAPRLGAASPEVGGAFVQAAGLVIGEATASGAGQVAVGLTNTTHFLRSLTSGRARVEAVALHQGRTQQLWQVNITDQAGRLIAHGEVRLQNVTAQPAQGNGETHE